MPDKGISVLIPVFNFDASDLIKDVHIQLLEAGVNLPDFEIRVYDDCSTEQKKDGETLTSNEKVVYKQLEKNIGRSKIRNLLAREAAYDNLLFLDCDTQIVSKRYISAYSNQMLNYEIIVGGTCYADDPPDDARYYLHWLVGKKKEEFKANIRQKHPYDGFTLNNMLIKKHIYLDILLDESITTYGHEDSKFGEELRMKNYSLKHIDNPVCHIGLNENKVFIEKSMQAIDNLYRMIINDGIGLHTKLYKTYGIIKKWPLKILFKLGMKIFNKVIYRNLLSDRPSLLLFDLLKLERFMTSYNK